MSLQTASSAGVTVARIPWTLLLWLKEWIGSIVANNRIPDNVQEHFNRWRAEKYDHDTTTPSVQAKALWELLNRADALGKLGDPVVADSQQYAMLQRWLGIVTSLVDTMGVSSTAKPVRTTPSSSSPIVAVQDHSGAMPLSSGVDTLQIPPQDQGVGGTPSREEVDASLASSEATSATLPIVPQRSPFVPSQTPPIAPQRSPFVPPQTPPIAPQRSPFVPPPTPPIVPQRSPLGGSQQSSADPTDLVALSETNPDEAFEQFVALSNTQQRALLAKHSMPDQLAFQRRFNSWRAANPDKDPFAKPANPVPPRNRPAGADSVFNVAMLKRRAAVKDDDDEDEDDTGNWDSPINARIDSARVCMYSQLAIQMCVDMLNSR